MKYPCELIQDILPLYCDDICSDTTNEIIKEHLSECEECSYLYSQLSEPNELRDKSIDLQPENLGQDDLGQDDLVIMKRLKARLRKKQIMTALISIVAACILIIGSVAVLMNTKAPIQYKDGNISVIAQEGELYYQLSANRMYPVTDVKTVELGEQTGEYALYFCFYTTLWDKAFGGEKKEFSTNHPFMENEVTKGNIAVSKIYYYSGDYSRFDSESETGINKIMEQSVLLWSRE